jgi:hypothetical protein
MMPSLADTHPSRTDRCRAPSARPEPHPFDGQVLEHSRPWLGGLDERAA